MPKDLNPKLIRTACRLHFNGDLLGDIAILLDVNPNTLSKWRKTQIWKDYYAELLEQYELAHGAADSTPPKRDDPEGAKRQNLSQGAL